MKKDLSDSNDNIDLLKRKLISTYAHSTLIILILYCVVLFLLHNTRFAMYIFGYFCIFLYTWGILHKNYRIKNIVNLHLLIGPSFVFLIFLLGKDSYTLIIGMFLLPVPVAAYVFFSKKYIIAYTIYILLIIFLPLILRDYISIDYQFIRWKNQKHRIFSDVCVFIINTYVISLLLHYKDKIKKAEVENTNYLISISNSEKLYLHQESIVENKDESLDIAKVNIENENLEKYLVLFEKVKMIVEQEKHFKNSELNISQLAAQLKTNHIYISKAIKAGSGNSNFNNYINKCRVEYVKKLIHEKDLSKVTLMYLYTAAGFSNQPNFNRVFKKMEGITPSEYIIKIQKNTNICHIGVPINE
jgi:AraC-like DNA-binding protein